MRRESGSEETEREDKLKIHTRPEGVTDGSQHTMIHIGPGEKRGGVHTSHGRGEEEQSILIETWVRRRVHSITDVPWEMISLYR